MLNQLSRRNLVIIWLMLASYALALPPAEASESAAEPQLERPKIGLALAGGGAKGCAHIGVLQVLEELGVPIDYVAGTSMGAVVGGLYAAGYSADYLEELVTTIDWSTVMQDRPLRVNLSFQRKQDSREYPFDLELGLKKGRLLWPRGLSNGQNLFLLLRNLTLPVRHVDDFDRMPIPFRAIAADVQTGERVVLDRGDPADAIRASMAIPGYFTPTEIDGRTLVDGGVVDNLPIDVVREMGADIVIAVNLGDTLVEGQTQTMIDILKQTQAMLTRRNVDPQLERAELVINPDVSAFGLFNFEVAPDIIRAGLEAATTHAEALQALAFVEPYRDEARQQVPRSIEAEYLEIAGDSRVHPRIINALVDVELGKSVDLADLEADIISLYGLGDFEAIEYDLARDSEGQQGVLLTLHDKPWGPAYLRFGLDIQSSDAGDSLGLRLNYTATRLNSRGAEWRNDLSVGTDLLLSSEFFQPLDFHGGWFVAARGELAEERRGFFESGIELAEFDIERAEVQLDLGYQFGRFGEVRLGIERGRAEVSLASGLQPLPIGDELREVDFGASVIEATLDRLDTAVLPLRGSFVKLRLFRAEESLGGEDNYTKASLESSFFHTRGRHTLLLGIDGGWSPGGALPLYDEFNVGGFLSFSGFQEDELRGQDFGVLRAGYLYRIASGGTFARRTFLGGWLEAGNAWSADQDPSLDDLIYAATAAIGADTLVGPIFLAYGWAEEGAGR
ncbi:MAG: patatin-like phospholipase family protein, partial [Acidobacteriota bacterium]